MYEFETKCFGKLRYRADAVIDFPAGLPGFEQERRFLLIQQPINGPIVFLQSLSRPELCFITLPVSNILPGYQLRLCTEELRTLGLPEDAPAGGDALCLGIVALCQQGPATINLQSPIVVNWAARRAVQALETDSENSYRHPLFAGTPEAECW